MSLRTITLDDRLYAYLIDTSTRETPLLAELREETAALPAAAMQISPEQGQFMALIARTLRARRYLEIGVFTGYSCLVVAQALPPEGHVVALDVSEEWTSIARRYWERAGISDRVELRLQPALVSLDELLTNKAAESFDLAFIDADKVNYVEYYERTLRLLRPGGVVMIDNTLWSGSVADQRITDDDTVAIRQFNSHVHEDQRVDLSLVPIGDGLTIARKRQGCELTMNSEQ